MIYNTYFNNITEDLVQLKANTSQDTQNLLAKYKQMLLLQLKVGDLLQGILIKGDGQNYILEVKQGIKFPVALLGEAEVGKVLEFMVQKNENGQLYLNVKDGQQQSILDKVITTLNLPNTPQMENCIKSFIEGDLTLDKETLLQSHYLHKKLQLPTPVITTILERTGLLDMPALEKVGELKQGGLLDIIGQLKGIIERIPDKEPLLKILNTLTTDLEKKEVEELLLTGKDLHGSESASKTDRGLHQLESFFKSQEVEGFEKLKENFKELDTKLFLKEAQQPQLLKEALFKVLDKLTVFTSREYETNKIKAESAQTKPIVETYKHLAKVVNALEKVPLENQSKQQLVEIRDTVATLGKLNVQADYFMFPYMPGFNKAQGEVYFFKPNKKDKKTKEEIYAVVALDLPALDHVEVHVKKHGNNLALGIHTQTKAIQEHMIEHMPQLVELLENLGYSICQCTYKLLQECEKGLDTSYAHIKLTSLDVKA